MNPERSEDTVCLCGRLLETHDQLTEHQRDCDHVKVQEWENILTTITSPGYECICCGRLLSLDDVFEGGKMLFYRPYEEEYICCPEIIMYPYEQEPVMGYYDVKDYLRLRHTTVPFPWLKEYRANLFKELQEYLYHPTRVQKWLDSGRDIESYLN